MSDARTPPPASGAASPPDDRPPEAPVLMTQTSDALSSPPAPPSDPVVDAPVPPPAAPPPPVPPADGAGVGPAAAAASDPLAALAGLLPEIDVSPPMSGPRDGGGAGPAAGQVAAAPATATPQPAPAAAAADADGAAGRLVLVRTEEANIPPGDGSVETEASDGGGGGDGEGVEVPAGPSGPQPQPKPRMVTSASALSFKTEASASSSSSSSSSGSSSGDSDGDDSSSDSSSDPSVEPRPPSELAGNNSNGGRRRKARTHKRSRSVQDIESGVLMREYVTREASGAAPDLTPAGPREDSDRPAGGGGGVLANLGITSSAEDDDVELGPLDGDGAIFYEAYRRTNSRGSTRGVGGGGGEGSADADPSLTEDAELTARTNRGRTRRGGRKKNPGRQPKPGRRKRLGEDRATLRSTAVRRLTRPAMGRRRGRGGAAGPYGNANGGNHSHNLAPAGTGYDGGGPYDVDGSWTHPQKRRRRVYGAMALLIVIVGMSLVVVGFTRRGGKGEGQQQGQGSGREFDPNEDGWVVDGDGNGIELGPLGGTTSGGMIPGTTSGGGQSGAAPAPDVPPPTPAPVPDDALLATLKQAYYDDFYASRGQSFVDTSTLPLLSENNVGTPGKPQRTATAQWRAYRYLSSRSDVWDASSGTVTMDVERLLQVYALKVFYLTFEWSVVGDDECAWPGVTCRGLGVHADDSEVGEDDLRVVGLSVRGDVSAADRRGPDLVGEMPLELAFLIHLEQIDLSHNRLDGELRGEVLGWKNVRVIELNDNLLSGKIPPELGQATQLTKLTLHHNLFSGTIPPSLCDLRSDRSLHFLWVDCSPDAAAGGTAKVRCPVADCCTICFEGYSPDLYGTYESKVVDGTKHAVSADRMSELKTRLVQASADHGTKLLDVSTPEFRAYAWLVEDARSGPDGGDYGDDRLLRRYALSSVYFSAGGGHWLRRDGWLTPQDECDWEGVSGCDGGGSAVTGLDLKENKLKGEIAPEVMFLPDLAVLNMVSNDLIGPIPREIGRLTKLSVLELAENHLTSIPSEVGLLTGLDHAFLQSNDFGGQIMPPEVCALRPDPLTLLWADCNGDEPVLVCPDDCCTTCFTNGVSEDGTEGYFAGTDGAVVPLDQDSAVLDMLRGMSLDDGASLEDHTSPQYKAYNWMVQNGELGDPTDALVLQRYALTTLYFSTAGHGWVDQVGWLTGKNVCLWQGIDECDAEGIVTGMDLTSTGLVGTIPVEITHLRNIEVLDLSDNELYGTIPTAFGLFEDLEILRLGGNLIKGHIPSELGNVLTLEELYLHFNELDGPVPPEVCAGGAQNNLYIFWADCGNDFYGVDCGGGCCTECFHDDSDFTLYAGWTDDTDAPTASPAQGGRPPPSAGGQAGPPAPSPGGAGREDPELKTFLQLHMGEFGLDPDDVNSPAYEAYLWLAGSQSLLELNDFHKLQRFGMAAFYMATTEGELNWKVSNYWNTARNECTWFGVDCATPNEDGEEAVTQISLPSNRLAGTIPREIALAGIGGQLMKLNLAGNNLRGQLPDELGSFKSLVVLDLRANDFSGQIPTALGRLKKLEELQLNSNDLSGEMPEEVCSLAQTQVLITAVADCDPTSPFGSVTCNVPDCCSACT